MKRKEPRDIDITGAAKRLLGLDQLRPGQEEAVRALLDGRDTVFVAPSGFGKSAVHQIAGSLIEGAAVCVSPTALRASHLVEPEALSSTPAIDEQLSQLGRIKEQKEDFTFLAPEELREQEVLERLKAVGVALFTVEEAHCISPSGHAFRSDYQELARVIEVLGHPPTLALTAAASNEIRAEIVERLQLRNPLVLIRGFDRSNIHLRVDTFGKEPEKLEAVLRRVEFTDKPGIIYVATHQHAEQIAADLRERGVESLAYHGGMKAKEREAIEDQFASGNVPVIVATNAFCAGNEKADIRFVYHADVSESLDAYYQEIECAGRDGKAAEAVLFYRARDISAQRYKTGAGKVEASQIESVANVLAGPDNPKTPEDLSRETGISPRKLTNILHKFEETGAARKLASGKIQLDTEQSAAEIAEAALKQQQSVKDLRSRRLEQMQEYAEIRTCRREYLLRYFGDEFIGPCGNCDRCDAARALQARPA